MTPLPLTLDELDAIREALDRQARLQEKARQDPAYALARHPRAEAFSTGLAKVTAVLEACRSTAASLARPDLPLTLRELEVISEALGRETRIHEQARLDPVFASALHPHWEVYATGLAKVDVTIEALHHTTSARGTVA